MGASCAAGSGNGREHVCCGMPSAAAHAGVQHGALVLGWGGVGGHAWCLDAVLACAVLQCPIQRNIVDALMQWTRGMDGSAVQWWVHGRYCSSAALRGAAQ